MDKDAYLAAVQQLWDRDGRPWDNHGLHLFSRSATKRGQRQIAEDVARRLAAICEELEHLAPPEADALDVDLHYVQPLARAARRHRRFADGLGKRMHEVDFILAMEHLLWPPEEREHHDWSVAYGLPPFWVPPG